MKKFKKKTSCSNLNYPQLSGSINAEINREINEVREIESFTSEELEIIDHYMIHGDETKAYRSVIKTATDKYGGRNEAVMFFLEQRIADEIKRRQIIVIRNHLSLVEKLIREYQSVALANMDDYAIWTRFSVTLKPSDELTRFQKAAVAEVKSTPHGPQIKLFKKENALRDLSKILQLLRDTLDITSGGETIQSGTTLILPDNHREFTE
jgi:hypothetical protein